MDLHSLALLGLMGSLHSDLDFSGPNHTMPSPPFVRSFGLRRQRAFAIIPAALESYGT